MSASAVTALVNGAPGDSISISDRGLLYGDGLFETIAVLDAQPRFWNRHMARLRTGCHRLGMPRIDEGVLISEAQALLSQLPAGSARILKIIITRGSAARGYRPDANAMPTRILQLYDWPEIMEESGGLRVRLCTLRLGHNPQLAGIKHLNRLEQVLARAEWHDPDIHEGLLLDNTGHVIEATSSNLFLVDSGRLFTPDLTRCGVAGIMRSAILDLAEREGWPATIRDISKDRLLLADEVFLCNSLSGVRAVTAIDGNRFEAGPLTARLRADLQDYHDDPDAWRG